MLALLTIAICITSLSSFVGGHPTVDRKSISFALEREYTIARGHDTSDTQTVFELHPASSEAQDDSDVPSVSVPLNPSRTHYTLRARPTTVYRPVSNEIYQAARLRSLHYLESQTIEWETADVLGPDIEDQHTLGQLARMTGNAYALPGQKNWYDLDEAWNTVSNTSSSSTTDV